ncbi:MAG: hypothetical protein AAF489_14875 [Bacteroidota bacterium]
MKKYLVLIIVFALACQKEELTVVQDQEEKSFLEDRQLVNLIQSVSSHDGTFDDLVDQSSCFSINFPYEVLLNGETFAITSINDLLVIKPTDEVTPVFPIALTTANYIEIDVENEDAFANYVFSCANGMMYDDRITCVDFSYPISISLYNRDETTFETIIYNHDKETFEGLELFEEGTLATIQFPIRIRMLDGSSLDIRSNEELKSRILQMLSICPN